MIEFSPEKWMLCKQGMNDRVYFYLHTNPDERSSLAYYKFFEFLGQSVRVHAIGEFRLKIDNFKNVLIDMESGRWEAYDDVVSEQNSTYEELVELNAPREEKPQGLDAVVTRSKSAIDKYLDKKYKGKPIVQTH